MVLKPRILAPDWTGDDNPKYAGKCIWTRPSPAYDPFFDDEDEAIKICNGDIDGVICPIRHACLYFALINNESYGIWGGTYPHDRKRIRHTIPRRDWRWQPPTPKPEDEPEESGSQAA
jgi:hypothetical protein